MVLLKMHYGGKFVNDDAEYEGGFYAEEEDCNLWDFNYNCIQDIGQILGYEKVVKCAFRVRNTSKLCFVKK